MNLKHTPGVWTLPHFVGGSTGCQCGYVLAEGYCGAVAEVFYDNMKRIADGGNDCPPRAEAEANARLIAAAPVGLSVAMQVYTELLRLPVGSERIRLQGALCSLRDYIAEATGETPQAVQEEFEETAAVSVAHNSLGKKE
jgi:hypothetical protein